MSDDDTLEEAFRAGLQRRADDVDTAVPLVPAARQAVRRRRRTRLVAGLAAAGVAAAVVTAVVVRDDGRAPGGKEDPDGVAVDPGPDEPLPTNWRTETWHGLSVDVPADWGWGVAPTSAMSGQRDQYLCGGPGALVESSGKRRVNPVGTEPWVGRPNMASDLCMQSATPDAKAAYVWLGAAIEPGSVDAGNGYTQETVEVAGTTLTVATRDAGVRARIIASAGPSDSGCAPSLDDPPVVEGMLTEGLRNPTSAKVCAYRHDEGAATWDLVYATTLDAEQATRYHSQVYDGGFESSPDFCESYVDERVLISITGDDPMGSTEVTQATVVDPFCHEVSGAPGMVSPLSDQGMKAWSRNGMQVSLYGLIGPMG
jgi:hypothetical protein